MFHKQQIHEMEINLRHKVHGYSIACLETIQKDLTREVKAILTQFDLFIGKELEHNKMVNKYERIIKEQERVINELKSYAVWEETTHDYFARGLREEGLSRGDLELIAMNETVK
jgi:hypothetical protein